MAETDDIETRRAERFLALLSDGENFDRSHERQKRFRKGKPVRKLRLRRRPIRERRAFLMRMKRKNIPEQKFLRQESRLGRRAPDHSIRRFIETVPPLRFFQWKLTVRPARPHARLPQNHLGRHRWMPRQKHPLASHRNPGKSPALIPASLRHKENPRPPDAPRQIKRKLPRANRRRPRHIQRRVFLTPRIESAIVAIGRDVV